MLQGLYLRDSALPGLVARTSVLADAASDRCDVRHTCLSGCRAPGAQIMQCGREEADLARFSLPAGALRRSRLVCANLNEASLYGSDLSQAVFGQIARTGTSLHHTQLENTDGTLRRLEIQR